MKTCIATTLVGALFCNSIDAQVTQRVSLSSTAAQADLGCTAPRISPDGRYVAFVSAASNLVPNDTNGVSDVFVRDRDTGTTERVSVGSFGQEANARSGINHPSISADGRYVAFDSDATNLFPGDTGNDPNVFVRDRVTGVTELVSVLPSGAGAYWSVDPSISADGRYVAYSSYEEFGQQTSNGFDIYVFDRQTGTTEWITDVAGGATDHCFMPSISADGSSVAFISKALNLGDSNPAQLYKVYVWDRWGGPGGNSANRSYDNGSGDGHSGVCIDWVECGLSGDGRYVVFPSSSTNLVPGDTNGRIDVFLHDFVTFTTERISVNSSGVQGDLQSGGAGIAISADARFVVFPSYATNLVAGDTNGFSDIFIRDRLNGTTELVSVDSFGMQASAQSGLEGPAISDDGRYVAFGDHANNLAPGDSNGVQDIFVRTRTGGTRFFSLCEPGVGGVIACPCSNPPGGADRGCNNSSGTGGAMLSAAGATSLSSDSLIFTTSGEKPTALSILAQWVGGHASGVSFGQGVRCTSGTFKRLFAKNAVAGGIMVPNFPAGDPSVSARSAAKGDTILPGQARWYVVYYRDNTILGGCPATSTFNATQTGKVTWNP